MFVNFFIRRPVFATVCSLIIMLVGTISLPTLAIEYYPDVTPPTVTVTANYPGASAETVETNVTTILETQINGVEGMNYIDSISDSNGGSNITVTFEQGYDKNIAAVDVQNRISAVQAQLPQEVAQTGVSVSKAAGSFVNIFALYSPDDRYDSKFISNYATLFVVDALKRVPGVGSVQVFGERTYAMRLWLDPNRLASRGLTAMDVTTALAQQNIQVGAGIIGAPPAPVGQEFQIGVQALSRLATSEEFGNIVIQTGADGSLVRVRDVGRTELGAQDYTGKVRFNGKNAVGLGINQLTGANALDVARATEVLMAELKPRFPPGLEYKLAFDTTEAVREAMGEVLLTLAEAIGLVVVVIFVFLQDWRTTLIPTLTIPVSLIGTFAFIKVFDFSINSLTLFGLVLATGLVVDDAIVVIENITRLIEERDLEPMDAAIESMREVTGAVIATSLVLMAVFIPVVVFPGVTGRLYQQFALTIVFSIALSTFNALTLTPTLSALLLRRGSQAPQNRFFRWVNWGIAKTRRGYESSLTWITRFKAAVLAVFFLLIGVTYWLFIIVPGGFVPEEDQGYFVTVIQSPQGVSQDYTDKVVAEVNQELMALPEVADNFAVTGFSFFGTGPDKGIVFTILKPWSQRQPVQAIIPPLMGKFSQITGALVFSTNVPVISVGSSLGGFDLQVQDQGNVGLSGLSQAVGALIAKGNATSGLAGLNTPFAINAPQLQVEVDRDRALALNVDLEDVFNTLQIFLGSSYVNNFNLFARSYRVIVQADQQFRNNPDDLKRLYVRSQNNQMIPLSNLVKVTQTVAPQIITHHNLFRSAEVTGNATPGTSSGQALQIMEGLANQVLPRGIGYSWTGLSLEEQKSAGQAPLIFGLGLIFVFLVLAAQYESYVDPLIIILSVPLAILGALAAQLLRGLPNDVFCQIGLVMLIGLASKNAILIVEFANQKKGEGLSNIKAAIAASEERLRPILMTALSFIFGTLPLVFASGSGAAARQSLGTAVYGGMLASTFLSLFIVPVIFIVVNNIRDRAAELRKRKSKSTVQ